MLNLPETVLLEDVFDLVGVFSFVYVYIMHHLPIEIINYCLLYADTGTKLIYRSNKNKWDFIYDFTHSKYEPILRLFSQREIQIDNENIIHIHLPWLMLDCPYLYLYKRFFVANITIYNNIQQWNAQKIYVKETDQNKKVILLKIYLYESTRLGSARYE